MRRRTATGIAIAGAAAVAGLVVLGVVGKWGPSSAETGIAGYWVSAEKFETTPFLDILPDGTFTGSDGCNGTQGTWSLSGDRLTVEAGPSTLMACEGAPLPMYFATAKTARLVDGALELRDADGKVLITLVSGKPRSAGAVPGDDPVDHSAFYGSWVGEATGEKTPAIELAEDGTFSGNDGCNQIRGEWSAADTTITFGPIASTRMFCEGVDTWLSLSATASLTGDALEFQDEAGKVLGNLHRES